MATEQERITLSQQKEKISQIISERRGWIERIQEIPNQPIVTTSLYERMRSTLRARKVPIRIARIEAKIEQLSSEENELNTQILSLRRDELITRAKQFQEQQQNLQRELRQAERLVHQGALDQATLDDWKTQMEQEAAEALADSDLQYGLQLLNETTTPLTTSSPLKQIPSQPNTDQKESRIEEPTQKPTITVNREARTIFLHNEYYTFKPGFIWETFLQLAQNSEVNSQQLSKFLVEAGTKRKSPSSTFIIDLKKRGGLGDLITTTEQPNRTVNYRLNATILFSDIATPPNEVKKPQTIFRDFNTQPYYQEIISPDLELSEVRQQYLECLLQDELNAVPDSVLAYILYGDSTPEQAGAARSKMATRRINELLNSRGWSLINLESHRIGRPIYYPIRSEDLSLYELDFSGHIPKLRDQPLNVVVTVPTETETKTEAEEPEKKEEVLDLKTADEGGKKPTEPEQLSIPVSESAPHFIEPPLHAILGLDTANFSELNQRYLSYLIDEETAIPSDDWMHYVYGENESYDVLRNRFYVKLRTIQDLLNEHGYSLINLNPFRTGERLYLPVKKDRLEMYHLNNEYIPTIIKIFTFPDGQQLQNLSEKETQLLNILFSNSNRPLTALEMGKLLYSEDQQLSEEIIKNRAFGTQQRLQTTLYLDTEGWTITNVNENRQMEDSSIAYYQIRQIVKESAPLAIEQLSQEEKTELENLRNEIQEQYRKGLLTDEDFAQARNEAERLFALKIVPEQKIPETSITLVSDEESDSHPDNSLITFLPKTTEIENMAEEKDLESLDLEEYVPSTEVIRTEEEAKTLNVILETISKHTYINYFELQKSLLDRNKIVQLPNGTIQVPIYPIRAIQRNFIRALRKIEIEANSALIQEKWTDEDKTVYKMLQELIKTLASGDEQRFVKIIERKLKGTIADVRGFDYNRSYIVTTPQELERILNSGQQ